MLSQSVVTPTAPTTALLWEICGSHSGVTEEPSLPVYEVVLFVKTSSVVSEKHGTSIFKVCAVYGE